jgi:hypothetical protein
VLAQGSHPRPHGLEKHCTHLTALYLDTCLKPSVLGTIIPTRSKVGVAGSSHSAVLVLKSLYELGNVSVVNFSRSPLLYTIYKDGWILYDNTGLKRIAADWAREVLEAKELPPRLRRANLKANCSEQEI